MVACALSVMVCVWYSVNSRSQICRVHSDGPLTCIRMLCSTAGKWEESVLENHKGLLDLYVCSRLYRFELTSKSRSLIPLVYILEEREIEHFQYWENLLISAVHLISLLNIDSTNNSLFYRGVDIGSFGLKWNSSLASSQKALHHVQHNWFLSPSIPQDPGIQTVLISYYVNSTTSLGILIHS